MYFKNVILETLFYKYSSAYFFRGPRSFPQPPPNDFSPPQAKTFPLNKRLKFFLPKLRLISVGDFFYQNLTTNLFFLFWGGGKFW